MSATIRVQLFARLREMAGKNTVEVAIPPEGCSVAGMLAALKADPELGDSLSAMTVLTAVNQAMARAEDQIMPGDEVALFPPVTGG